MVRVIVAGGAGSKFASSSIEISLVPTHSVLTDVGRGIVEGLVAQGKHEVIVWSRKVSPCGRQKEKGPNTKLFFCD